MGLTGGVKSHRLSGQISPYCEKKRHWLCAYCAPMFLLAVKVMWFSICFERALTSFSLMLFIYSN